MEARLKKERRKLFRRILLIMLGIWLVVSAAFCVVRMNIEKETIKYRESETLDCLTNPNQDTIEFVLEQNHELFYEKDYTHKDCQLVISDQKTNKPYLNSSYVFADKYGMMWEIVDDIEKTSCSLR